MKRTQRFPQFSILAACLLALAQSLPAQTPNTPYASAEQARQALAVLRSDAPSGEKAVACKRLAVFGGADAVPVLATFLSNKDLASWARIPLEVIPGPVADAALREALGRVQGNLLVGVINSIGVRADAKAVDPLVVFLKDPDAEVASAAAVALGKIGGTPASTALEAALASAPAAVRGAVGEGLILCAERLAASPAQASDAQRLYDVVRRADVPKQRQLEAARGAILARPDQGLPRLLEILRAPDRATFQMALRVARELPGRAVTEALAAELEKVPADRQSGLLLAVTDRGDEAAWPAVVRAAKEGSRSLRLVAIAALERRADAGSVSALLEAATASDAEVTKAAKAALGRLPGKDLDGVLVARLSQATGPSRQVLVELAGKRRVATAVPDLFKAASDSDPELRAAGLEALGETVGVKDLGGLADLLAKSPSEDDVADVEGALDAACSRLTDKPACAEALLARLPSAAPAARVALLRVLGTVGTPNGLAAVRGSLTHGEKSVRDAAFRVLADWQEPAALPALLEVIRKPADETQRTLALRGAVRLLGQGDQPAAQSVRTYGELLGLARSVDDRKLVLSGLGSIPDPAAAKLVEPLASDAAVRKEAESALLNIAGALAGSSPADAKALASRLQKESQDAAIRERAGQVLQRMDQFEDYLTAWQFAGAYKLGSNESGSLFAKEFPPEAGDDKVAWRPLAAGTQAARPYMLDLLATKSGDARCAGYARTWVYSDIAQPARVEFGTDDGHKLWCNGEPIAKADRGGAAVPGEFKSIVSLRQGWNTLLLKVIQDSGPWEFCLRLRTPTGGKLSGLRVQATPPEK